MSLFSDFKFDVRHSFAPALKLAAVCILGGMLVLSLVVGVIYITSDKAKPPASVLDGDRIPTATYAAGFVQVLDCIRAGEKTCTHYKDAKRYIVAITPEAGIAYRPARPTDPGEITTDGLKRISLTMESADRLWRTFASAATRNGRVSPETVSETAVSTPSEGTATFPVNGRGAKYTGTMVIDTSQDGVTLVSLDYVRAG